MINLGRQVVQGQDHKQILLKEQYKMLRFMEKSINYNYDTTEEHESN